MPACLHDLRHGQASLMLPAWVDVIGGEQAEGHSTINITSEDPIRETGSIGGPGNTGDDERGPLAQLVELRTFNP